MDVVILGHDVAEGLFAKEDPLGRTILVAGVPFEVIGVLEKRKGQFFRDESAEKAVLVPYRSYRRHNPSDDEHFLGVEANPGRKAAAEEIGRAHV